eukprot:6614879-Alexandrium_andersonii.AAC.1
MQSEPLQSEPPQGVPPQNEGVRSLAQHHLTGGASVGSSPHVSEQSSGALSLIHISEPTRLALI